MDHEDSWRLIEVREQLALLQEGVVSQRLRGPLRVSVPPGQSGYVRDVADAHLLLHEVVTIRLRQGLPTFQVPGDVAKAFPRTCWVGFLMAQQDHAGVRGGIWALQCSMLEWDLVQVCIGAVSTVSVVEGVTEGSVLGPMGFTIWFDSLARFLCARGHGVAVGAMVPQRWLGFSWSGIGCPSVARTSELVHAIKAGLPLPSQQDLRACSTLEASALRALDQTAAMRLALVLHAEDPVILASSRG